MILVDSNVILDIFTQDKKWYEWSSLTVEHWANLTTLAINPIIYTEVSIRFTSIEELNESLSSEIFKRIDLPWEAAFLAGKSYLQYRKQGGNKSSPLPDFYIGAHAAVSGLRLMTRDSARYKTYFPSIEVICP